jgi:hypothetical protein
MINTNAESAFNDINYINFTNFCWDYIHRLRRYIMHSQGVAFVNTKRRHPSDPALLQEHQGLIWVRKVTDEQAKDGFEIIITLRKGGDSLLKLGVLAHEVGHAMIHLDMLLNNESIKTVQEDEATDFARLVLRDFMRVYSVQPKNDEHKENFEINENKITSIIGIINPPGSSV